jgi:hypothetical protein
MAIVFNSYSAPLAAAIAGVAFVAGLAVLGGNITSLHRDGIITVRGAAELPVEADLATWRIMIGQSGNDLKGTQTTFAANLQVVRDFLVKNGLKDEEIENQPVQVNDANANQYRSGPAPSARYNINGGVLVRSGNLEAVQKAKSQLAEMGQQGVVISGSEGPNYAFSSLSQSKPELVAQSTREARKAALQFAEGNNLSVKRLVSARQGSVEILGRDTFLPEPEQVHKVLRVVTTVDYQLE